MLQSQIGHNAPAAAVTTNRAVAADDTDVVITLAALSNHRHILHGVQWSYDAAPGADDGMLTVEDGAGTTIFEVDIGATLGVGSLNLLLPGSLNTAMVITLNAGGAAVMGKLNTQSTVSPA